MDARIEGQLPLKPVDFLVLLVLERGQRHGYGIVQDVEAETDGSVRLVPGNLYAVLHRLMEAGLLEEAPRKRGEDERRRNYRLTGRGRRTLAAEAERMRDLVRLAEARRILKPAADGRGGRG
ncbi:MAG: helix-turn-helix transcriptional regulator [Gemmatimonadota bacterium]|jgi:DNA-binding PadR family transcriptional regulator